MSDSPTPVESEETPEEITEETAEETVEETPPSDEAKPESEDAPSEESAEDELPTPDVTVEELSPCRRKIHLSASPEAIEAHREAKYKEISDKAQVPGFRPGRAPRRLLVKRFGEDIDKDIKRDLVVAGFEKALGDNDLELVGQPDMDIENLKLPDEGEMVFDIEIEVKPSFELPAYKKIPLEQQDADVTDAEIDEQFESLRKRVAYGTNAFESVEKGSVQYEDLLTAEVVGTLAEGGEEFYKDEERSMIVSAGMLILHPTRDESKAMEGVKVGETRTVDGHVGPRHEDVEQRGKDAKFAVTVKEIKRLQLPEVDDEFASQVGAESVDDLRERVRDNAVATKADQARDANRENVRAWLIENTTLELPAEMLDRQKERSLVQRKIRMLRQGVPEAVVLEQEEDLKKAVAEQVERDLKLSFIVERIADAEDISTNEEEINGIVSAIAQQSNRRFARMREEMDQDGRLELLAADVLERKVLDELIKDADFTAAKKSEEMAEKKETSDSASADDAKEDA